jgi:small subunit ribosomal protein YMR-31
VPPKFNYLICRSSYCNGPGHCNEHSFSLHALHNRPALFTHRYRRPNKAHPSHMHPSLRVAHKQLISFIGKRQWPPGKFPTPPGVCFVFKTVTGPQLQRPHPAAPTQFKEAFSDFLERYKNFSFPSTSSSNGKSSGRPIFNEFWDAPEYLWRPKVRKLEDSEIDAVLVSRNSSGIPFLVITCTSSVPCRVAVPPCGRVMTTAGLA